ncbi:MAG: hypothetical protein IK117_04950 [Bacteroidales bacterium]|nr:hypothetical protein [Bacteroidales bacterium]
MKKIISLIVISIVSLCSYSQNNIHSTPENLVNGMITAIKNKDYCTIRDLADPYGNISKSVGEYMVFQYLDKEQQDGIIKHFSSLTLTGYATYESVPDGDSQISFALVPVKTIVNGKTLWYKMKLRNRAGMWFLVDFVDFRYN